LDLDQNNDIFAQIDRTFAHFFLTLLRKLFFAFAHSFILKNTSQEPSPELHMFVAWATNLLQERICNFDRNQKL
jgi:hypothetical protein